MTQEPLTSVVTRDVKDILLDLEHLCQEEGFIYTFSFITFTALWMPAERIGEVNWHERPNHQELALILGFLVKHPLNLAIPESEDVFYYQNDRAHKLLEELHQAHAFTYSGSVAADAPDSPLRQDATAEAYQDWMDNGSGMVEPIFYAAEGASEYQFLETAERRYKYDSQWIQDQKGMDLGSMIKVTKQLKESQLARAQNLQYKDSLRDFCRQCFDLFLFKPEDFPHERRHALQHFISAFSIRPGDVNDTLDSIGGYNTVHSHPIVQVSNDNFYVSLLFYLCRSIYESPFYWMVRDEDYRDVALQNRGNATEEIAYETLKMSFGDNVYRDIKARKDGQDVTDIDVLVVFDNKAVIVQAKSKKLRISSRLGEGESIRSDFQEAVQSAYDQALISRLALTDHRYELVNSEGKCVLGARALDDVYILCITGDYYPALSVQIQYHLRRSEDDPYPLAMSLFDLEILSCHLKDPYDFLYYLRQRTLTWEQFRAVSELALLGFHVESKLRPMQDVDFIWVDEHFSESVKASYLMMEGHWPRTHSKSQLAWNWRNESFERIIESVKGLKVSGITDAIFYLFDLAGAQMETLAKYIERVQIATLKDGNWHDCSMPMAGYIGGISYICYPAPSSPREFQMYRDHFQSFGVARKYKGYANEWIALASITGTPKFIDMVWYSREPWQADQRLEELGTAVLKPGKVLDSAGRKLRRKPSRNQPCPCGSQLKYKKCHGR